MKPSNSPTHHHHQISLLQFPPSTTTTTINSPTTSQTISPTKPVSSIVRQTNMIDPNLSNSALVVAATPSSSSSPSSINNNTAPPQPPIQYVYKKTPNQTILVLSKPHQHNNKISNALNSTNFLSQNLTHSMVQNSQQHQPSTVTTKTSTKSNNLISSYFNNQVNLNKDFVNSAAISITAANSHAKHNNNSSSILNNQLTGVNLNTNSINTTTTTTNNNNNVTNLPSANTTTTAAAGASTPTLGIPISLFDASSVTAAAATHQNQLLKQQPITLIPIGNLTDKNFLQQFSLSNNPHANAALTTITPTNSNHTSSSNIISSAELSINIEPVVAETIEISTATVEIDSSPPPPQSADQNQPLNEINDRDYAEECNTNTNKNNNTKIDHENIKGEDYNCKKMTLLNKKENDSSSSIVNSSNSFNFDINNNMTHVSNKNLVLKSNKNNNKSGNNNDKTVSNNQKKISSNSITKTLSSSNKNKDNKEIISCICEHQHDDGYMICCDNCQ